MEPTADSVALYREASQLLQDRRVREATQRAEELASLEPDARSALELLARTYFAGARLGRAAEVFQRLVDGDPIDVFARIGLARTLQRLSRPDEAATHARIAVALDPNADTLALLESLQAAVTSR
jgi:Flp pilus assembly protein TadD